MKKNYKVKMSKVIVKRITVRILWKGCKGQTVKMMMGCRMKCNVERRKRICFRNSPKMISLPTVIIRLFTTVNR